MTVQQRPRLVDPDMGEQVALPGRLKRADGAAVAAGGETSGVAMRQRARAGPEQVGRVRGHRLAAVDLLLMQATSTLRRRLVAHLGQRPRQVDRRGPRRRERSRRRVEVVATGGRERETVGGRDADRRRAANRELADRRDELGDRPALQLDFLVGQAPLVEEDDPRAVLLVPNDVPWL
jgi:hypothetical protein